MHRRHFLEKLLLTGAAAVASPYAAGQTSSVPSPSSDAPAPEAATTKDYHLSDPTRLGEGKTPAERGAMAAQEYFMQAIANQIAWGNNLQQLDPGALDMVRDDKASRERCYPFLTEDQRNGLPDPTTGQLRNNVFIDVSKGIITAYRLDISANAWKRAGFSQAPGSQPISEDAAFAAAQVTPADPPQRHDLEDLKSGFRTI